VAVFDYGWANTKRRSIHAIRRRQAISGCPGIAQTDHVIAPFGTHPLHTMPSRRFRTIWAVRAWAQTPCLFTQTRRMDSRPPSGHISAYTACRLAVPYHAASTKFGSAFAFACASAHASQVTAADNQEFAAASRASPSHRVRSLADMSGAEVQENVRRILYGSVTRARSGCGERRCLRLSIVGAGTGP
jgi:hypothetical protein